ncbi:SusC/RagA family TonB-linked outer membrane protein [Formosa sp. S-31]|uniref:SusC/RagA family TonB-linked outer membrane protein n=1 Tax=Formosa sp. S-31 TaxID=2790949 RepID=UPI003EB736E1
MNNSSIHEILETLTKTTGVEFFYNYDVVDVNKKIKLNVKDKELTQVVLEMLGDNYNLKRLENDLIIIVPAAKLQQQLKVEGVVKDPLGMAMPGVTVLLKSKNRWDITREKGDFNIEASSNDTLIFSSLGYKTLSIPVNNRTFIEVKMEEELTQLKEVSIVGSNGYTDIPKERATGSFDVVTAETIEKTPTIDINSRLEGEVPGLKVDVRTGTMSIRGTNNYSATPPLVVIDGFPMPENDFKFSKKSFQGSSILSYLNAEDIESISVLKDAAAAAIWGSRAANGVIVIKTKNGKVSKAPVINFSTATTIGNKISLDKLRQMSTAEYVDFEKEMVDRGFLTDNSYNWQAKNPSEVQEVMFKAQRGEISLEERDRLLNEISNRNNQSQINKYLLRNSVSQQYDFSVSGGNDINTYFISTGYNKNSAVMRSNNSQSYSVTVNNNTKLKPFLTLETGVNYLKSDYNENNTANEALSNVALSSLRPYDMIADNQGRGLNKYLMFRPEVIQGFEDQGYLPWTYNYLDELGYSNNKTKGNNVRLNAKLTATITDWLSVEGSGMYNSIKNKRITLNELESYFSRNSINEATILDFYTQDLVYGLPLGARYYATDSKNNSQSLRFQFNVNKEFSQYHQLNFVAGSEIREEYREESSQTRFGYDIDTNTSQSVNPTEYYNTVYGWQTFIGSYDTSISKYRSRFLSYYSLGSYSYKNKYHVSGSFRFDDYNLLGASKKNRALPLWSTGVKWDISKENFLNTSYWLNNLSARVTYGKSGSSPTGGLGNSSALISLGYLDYDTQLPITSISNPENSQLKWETTTSLNFGLDFSLFNSRLNGNADLYYKKSEDILTNVPFNPTYGFSYLQYNTGTLEGHGFELGLTGIIFEGDFRWSSTFNFSYNTNEVTDSRFKAETVNDYLSGLQKTGESLASVYAYRWAGLDELGQSQIYKANGEILDSSRGIADVETEDLVYMGTTQAPYFGGFFNTFSYKNFSVDVRMTYYMGHVFQNSVLQNYPTYAGAYYGTSISKESIVANRWMNPGDEVFTDVPGLANVNYNSINRFQRADINVLPADNIRLQQVSLAYNLPAEFLEKTWFKSVSVSFAARNLGILWRKNDQDIDPMYLATNNYNTLPPERNYTLQFNLGF